MEVVKEMKKDEICAFLQDEYGMICFSSFEERCLTVPYVVSSCKIIKAFILSNIGESSTDNNRLNAEQIASKYSEVEIVEFDIEDSVIVSEKILEIIYELEERNIKNLLIDISTFTHEVLLIMLRLLHENKEFFSITCLYNGASNYSVGDKPEQVWLSKGCRDVRNIIGYPGLLKPSQKNHVIVLAGFEIERVTGLVELLEPDILSIGEGSEPTDTNHEDSMKYFRDKFATWKNTFQNVITDTFSFSCCDIEKTISLLMNIIDKSPEMNYILVPLNTKLSTLAVGLVALANQSIQVCYAIPEMYNSLGYSEPSNNITLVKLSEFKPFRWKEDVK